MFMFPVFFTLGIIMSITGLFKSPKYCVWAAYTVPNFKNSSIPRKLLNRVYMVLLIIGQICLPQLQPQSFRFLLSFSLRRFLCRNYSRVHEKSVDF
jgi:hypothetical protein